MVDYDDFLFLLHSFVLMANYDTKNKDYDLCLTHYYRHYLYLHYLHLNYYKFDYCCLDYSALILMAVYCFDCLCALLYTEIILAEIAPVNNYSKVMNDYYKNN